MFFFSFYFVSIFLSLFFILFYFFKKVGFSVVRLAVYFIKGTGAYNVSCATIGFFLSIGSSSSSQLCAMPRVYYIQTFIQLDAYIYQLTECVRFSCVDLGGRFLATPGWRFRFLVFFLLFCFLSSPLVHCVSHFLFLVFLSIIRQENQTQTRANETNESAAIKNKNPGAQALQLVPLFFSF